MSATVADTVPKDANLAGQPPSPDEVFDRLTDMFGDVADANVILDVGTRMAWNFEECIDRMIEICGTTANSPSPATTSSDALRHLNIASDAAFLSSSTSQPPPPPQPSAASFEISHWNSADLYAHPPPTVTTSHTGTIPKVPHSTFRPVDDHFVAPTTTTTMSSFLKHPSSSNHFTDSSSLATAATKQPKLSAIAPPAAYDTCLAHCRAGHRVLVCMRGPPGSGKSHLCRQLVAESVPHSTARHHIFGADDYFWRPNGRYEYNARELSTAHEYCQRAVRQRAAAGWSPLCVDNTNMQTWEMHAYVAIAVQFGYTVHVLEPNTPWRNSAGQLAQRNQHGVPKEKIAQMLARYQPCSREALLLECRVEYTMPMPQQRLLPPVQSQPPPPLLQQQSVGNATAEMTPFVSLMPPPAPSVGWSFGPSVAPAQPTPPETPHSSPEQATKLVDSFQLAAQQLQSVTVPAAAWPVDSPAKLRSTVVNSPHMQVAAEAVKTSLIELLRGDSAGSNNGSGNNNSNAAMMAVRPPPLPLVVGAAGGGSGSGVSSAGQRHKTGCRNENAAFAEIRSIFPAVPATTLWDLFEQCAGNAEWTMDILLTRETRVHDFSEGGGGGGGDSGGGGGELQCYCDQHNREPPPEEPSEVGLSVPSANGTPTRSLSRRERLAASQKNVELRRQIEDSVRIGDEHYSQHARNIRDFRRGLHKPETTNSDEAERSGGAFVVDQTETSTSSPSLSYSGPSESDGAVGGAPAGILSTTTVASVADLSSDDELSSSSGGGDDDGGDSKTIEVSLGIELIGQLESQFGVYVDTALPGIKTSVFMPKRMARELYALWIESLCNQHDEQRQRGILEDEAFALELQQQQQKELDDAASVATATTLAVSEQSTAGGNDAPPPSTRPNVAQIFEMKCAWAEYQRQQIPNQWQQQQQPLSAELTQHKLNELFPNIEPATLGDVMRLTNYDFHRTVDLLSEMRSDDQVRNDERLRTDELELMERAKFEAEKLTDAAERVFATGAARRDANGEKRVENAEEAKQVAMQHFEDCRNLAKHHTQMRSECYQKANKAIKTGSTEVAVYYSRVANLHKKKVDRCNQHAANCILEAHQLTNNNPDMLDLHYLYVKEAMECLDVFIDQHVSRVRSRQQAHKAVMVITGRGLHSSRGYSTVKANTKARLGERGLNWTEMNPGLLRIRVFQATKLSTEL